jgi:hypothetical protein
MTVRETGLPVGPRADSLAEGWLAMYDLLATSLRRFHQSNLIASVLRTILSISTCFPSVSALAMSYCRYSD